MTGVISLTDLTPANGWQDVRSWENDRVFTASITQERRDNQGDLLTLDAFVKAMPRFIERGVLIDTHSNKVRGKPLAWRVEGDKMIAAFGVYADSPNDDAFWETVKSCGDRCGTSIGADPLERLPGKVYTSLNIYELAGLRPGVKPSNPGAWVEAVNTLAKGCASCGSVVDGLPSPQEATTQSGSVVEGTGNAVPVPASLLKAKCPKCGHEYDMEKSLSPPAPAPQVSAPQQGTTTMTEQTKTAVPSEQLLADLKAGVESLNKCRTEFEATMKTYDARLAAIEKSMPAKPAETKPEDALLASLAKALEPMMKRLDAIEAKTGTPGKPTLQKSAASETDANGQPIQPKSELAALLEAVGYK